MAFATADDVATRLGGTLTDAQKLTAAAVIETVTGLIVDEVDRDAAWAEALENVPAALKALCVEKALAIVVNPAPGTVAAESLGAHSVTFTRSGEGGLFLTDDEKRLARSAVYGSLTGSSTPRALPDRINDLRENRDVDELP